MKNQKSCVSNLETGEPLGIPKFLTYNDSDIRTQKSLYFCSDDEITVGNIKVGTFRSAEEHCEKILTPRVCEDRTLAEKIHNVTLKAQKSGYNTGFGTVFSTTSSFGYESG